MADNPSDLVGKEFIFEYGRLRLLPPDDWRKDEFGDTVASEQKMHRRERITRCRDCKHAIMSYQDRYPRCAGPMVKEATLVDPDGFCAWGEPRDGNGVLEPPTERQLDFIESIQDVLGIEFKGSTKAEASEWIDEYFEEYRLESADSWALDHGYF